ncbi:MAG: YggS family pyridoxal phosphate-dependent enzyme [Candidatus Cloacimonadota bacterium]|nr:YggS family pyridoxal phosphate-dependent enzyme [Candidatus Cloacimonadota bacterium]
MDIVQNLKKVEERIRKAALRVDRDPSEIKLLAITKTHPVEKIKKALEFGIEYIGENKVQEAEKKIPELKGLYQEFHFVGHLQSNKIKKLIPLKPVLIHSLDKLSTIRKLQNYLEKNQMEQDILIEVNTSGESSKFGVLPDRTMSLVSEAAQYERVHIKGLMTIGKLTEDRKEIRGCFCHLRELFHKIEKQNFPNVSMQRLSMGMTNDFEIAIEEGANIVRIGSAIFGPREY